jgi:hypothetical protein
MKKGGILIIALLICVAYAMAVVPGQCIVGVTESYQCPGVVEGTYYHVGDTTATGLHIGAAEICGDCYVCGDADGVCPEDFESATPPNTKGDCSGCNDPDCSARITGNVYALGNGVPPFIPLQGAIVRAVPANPNLPEYYSEPTDYYGHYEINFLPAGWFEVAASLIGYDTEIKNITVKVREVGNVNFTLPNGTCHEDCTDSFARCADCQGVKGCNYVDDTVKALCMNRKIGDIIPYGPPDSSDNVKNVVCCNGNVTTEEYRPNTGATGCMDNLVTIQVPAILDGQPVVVNIAVWPSGEC